MTYIVKVRGGGRVRAEYRCPHHGVFAVTVDRTDSGDAPDEVECPRVVDHDGEGGVEECLERSPWTASATLGRVQLGEVVRGPNEKPPNRLSLDTRKLGEGQPLHEYREERERIQQEFRRSEIPDFKAGR